MGVKDLWAILAPTAEPATVNSIRGKAVAVDLSVWVCENSTAAWTQTQRVKNPHLRNLFFRSWFLVSHGITPVFVLEGPAPSLKARVMAARNASRGLDSESAALRPVHDADLNGPRERKQFAGVLRKCRAMLELMGLCCVTSEGEAESLCARLDSEKLVDGCFTQDSDAFLYGARTVYRNFRVTKNRAGGGATFDVFDMTRIEQVLQLDRERLIACALLLGCDYDTKGVARVGREKALKLLTEEWKGEGVKPLDRLRRWRIESEEFHKNCPKLTPSSGSTSSPRCSRCCHPGKTNRHERTGCKDCGTRAGCELAQTPNHDRHSSQLEVWVREKAVSDPDFPNEDIIREFSDPNKNRGHGLSPGFVKRCTRAPDLSKLIPFLVKELNWTPAYCLEKCFPLLTFWICHNDVPTSLKPDFPVAKAISKKCVKEGINCYEVQWEPPEALRSLVPAEVPPFSWISYEVQADIASKFPEVEAAYLESKAKPSKKKTSAKNNGSSDAVKTQGATLTAAAAGSRDIRQMFKALTLKETSKGEQSSSTTIQNWGKECRSGNGNRNRSPAKSSKSSAHGLSSSCMQRETRVSGKSSPDPCGMVGSEELSSIDLGSDSSFDDNVSDSELSRVLDDIVGSPRNLEGLPFTPSQAETGKTQGKNARRCWDLHVLVDTESPTTPSTFCDLDKTEYNASSRPSATPKGDRVTSWRDTAPCVDAGDFDEENSSEWDGRPLSERLGIRKDVFF